MTDGWALVFLGVIAGATLVMACVQIGAFIAALRLARQAQQAMTAVQQELRPLIARVQAIAEEASKTVALAATQAQAIDRLLTDLSRRADQTASVVQQAIVAPAREGLAILAALKAGFAALRSSRDRRIAQAHIDEEDPLFIG